MMTGNHHQRKNDIFLHLPCTDALPGYSTRLIQKAAFSFGTKHAGASDKPGALSEGNFYRGGMKLSLRKMCGCSSLQEALGNKRQLLISRHKS